MDHDYITNYNHTNYSNRPTTVKNKPSLLGTPLQYLIEDKRTCFDAKLFMEEIGIPTAIHYLIQFLIRNIHSTDIFRVMAPQSLIQHFFKKMDNDEVEQLLSSSSFSFRSHMDIDDDTSCESVNTVVIAANALLIWLNQLQEPLLGKVLCR